MALLIDLKPGERVIIGQALVTNDGPRTRLVIQGDAPILREKDILRSEDADTPCKRLYLNVQLMYVDQEPARFHAGYFDLSRQVQEAAPSTAPYLLRINEKIISGSYYQALKEAKKLVHYEARLLSDA
jgi:flagellar protein FlbT